MLGPYAYRGLTAFVLYRRERSWRVAIFFGGSALAGAFGGMQDILDMAAVRLNF